MTVDSVSQRPASQRVDSPSGPFAELQQAIAVFFLAQQVAVTTSLSSPTTAHSRSNHSGGWTALVAAQASFCERVKQPQSDQHACAFRHEQLQSMQGNGTDLSFTTGLGIEITKPLTSAQTNSNAEMARRSRIGCRKSGRDNI